MLPIGCIFFPLKVAPMIIDNNFKGYTLRNAKIKLHQYVCLLKLANFDASKIKCNTVVCNHQKLGLQNYWPICSQF